MSEPEEPSVRVTLGSIYTKLQEVERKVDRLPGEVSDHEIRIRAIEKYLWIWIGASGVAGAGISEVASLIINR